MHQTRHSAGCGFATDLIVRFRVYKDRIKRSRVDDGNREMVAVVGELWGRTGHRTFMLWPAARLDQFVCRRVYLAKKSPLPAR